MGVVIWGKRVPGRSHGCREPSPPLVATHAHARLRARGHVVQLQLGRRVNGSNVSGIAVRLLAALCLRSTHRHGPCVTCPSAVIEDSPLFRFGAGRRPRHQSAETITASHLHETRKSDAKYDWDVICICWRRKSPLTPELEPAPCVLGRVLRGGAHALHEPPCAAVPALARVTGVTVWRHVAAPMHSACVR